MPLDLQFTGLLFDEARIHIEEQTRNAHAMRWMVMAMVDVMLDVLVDTMRGMDHALLLYRKAMRNGLRVLRRTRAA